MSPDDAINECRQAFAVEAPCWASPLMRFLDDPANMHLLFDWITHCFRRLLGMLQDCPQEIEEQLALFETYLAESPQISVIQETVDRLWVLRSPNETAKTAMVKLFGALIAYRKVNVYRHLSCSVPITLLAGIVPDRRQALDVILEDFASFALRDRPTFGPTRLRETP